MLLDSFLVALAILRDLAMFGSVLGRGSPSSRSSSRRT